MTDKLCRISLFSAVLASITSAPSMLFADSRINSTHAGAYNQVMATQQQYVVEQNTPLVQTASATEDLPVAVEDARLAESIKNHTSNSITTDDLEKCSMIYINGVFKWGVPQSGMRQTLQPQCVAVVDLVSAETDEVLATTTLAAGDMMKCNIDVFPQSGYSPKAYEVTLPADNPPTEKDVEKVLNKEQKQNAGFKIAAAAIIGGLAGNALSPKASGDSKVLGTSKSQLTGSAIGALAAGGLMAASSYSGKVAGETIKSTAVNATAGMLVGNMGAGMSDTNSVLATTKCKVKDGTGKEVEKDCVIGHFYKSSKDSSIASDNDTEYYATANGAVAYKCENPNTDKMHCISYNNPLHNICFKHESGGKCIQQDSAQAARIASEGIAKRLVDGKMTKEQNDDSQTYYLIESAKSSGSGQMAYAVFDNLQSKVFGYKVSDWDKLKNNVKGYYARYNNTDSAGESLGAANDDNNIFKPSARSSEDGSIIDLSNEARAKATMLGAAAGGALGGFVGYQGAQAEISERLMVALNEYSASLQNFYCKTGKRILALYNDVAEIAPMPQSTGQE